MRQKEQGLQRRLLRVYRLINQIVIVSSRNDPGNDCMILVVPAQIQTTPLSV